MQDQPNLTQILPLEEKHHPGILAVAENLPEWYDETARTKSIPIDIRHQEGFVSVSGQKVVGFLTLYVAEGRLHIGWLGVARKFHKQGIGTRLLAAAERKARDLGIDELATYTLGDRLITNPMMEREIFIGSVDSAYTSEPKQFTRAVRKKSGFQSA